MSIFDGYIGNDRSTLAKDLRTQGDVRENNSFSGQSLVKDYDRFTKQILSPDGTTTDFTLNEICKDSASVLVVNDDVVQQPDTAYTVSGNSISFTAAPANGSELFVIYLGRIQQISTVADNSFTNSQIESIDVNKVYGTFSSNVDGSNLTNVVRGALTNTKSANDPAIDTNPSATGHVWVNTTTGDTYVCTDATAGANVWYNVGGGSKDVSGFQGTVSGYVSGGYDNDVSSEIDVIEKFSFSSDGNTTDIGNLTVSRNAVAGQSSNTHGYTSGGSPISDVIDKFSFTSDGDATDVGNLTVARYYIAGQSSSTHGYTSGGNSGGPISDVIDKFSFTSGGDATDVGNLTVARQGCAGQNSVTHGYSSGGHTPGSTDVIDKFSFASNGDATDVGNLTVPRRYAGANGQSSTTHGYTSGGFDTASDVIDKFSFASGGDATDVGDLTVAKGHTAGQSSWTHGYVSSGTSPETNTIEKFSFSVGGGALDVGDLTITRYTAAGTQY